ncbi:MAG: pilus assembly protein TadG-related protein [Alphaproteobacteria bacterium]|nr:pilus assembly protein TadG-related protein [Alphaproteobacteria bacterium]
MRFSALRRCESGSVLTTFAVTTVALLILLAVAIDFSRWNSERAALQSALDSTVLAAVKAGQTNVTYANSFFKASVQGTTAENLIDAIPTLACDTKDSTFSCTANGTVPTMTVGAFTGIKKLPLNVVAAAGAGGSSQQPNKLKFTVSRVKGWYWKKVTVNLRIRGVWTEKASIVYQPTDRMDNGFGDTRQTADGKTALCSMDCPQIDLGTDYDSAYLSMKVWTDGCDDKSYDKGFAAAPTNPPNNVVCTSGSKSSNNAVYTYTIFSNKEPTRGDPGATVTGTPIHIFVSSNQLKSLDTSGSLLAFVNCDTDISQSWEDTLLGPKDGNPPWASQDFVFRVSAECTGNSNFKPNVNGTVVKLTR